MHGSGAFRASSSLLACLPVASGFSAQESTGLFAALVVKLELDLVVSDHDGLKVVHF